MNCIYKKDETNRRVGYQIYHCHNDGFGLNTLRLHAVSVSKPCDQN
jgi:hypothetical protein